MKFTQILLTAVIAIVSAIGAVKYYAPQGVQTVVPVEKKETVYERVMRTGKLRCGYGLWEPAIMRDPVTGKMSGMFVDITEEIGKALDLKIEWSSEVAWGQLPIALNTNKVDLICAGTWASAVRAKHMLLSSPVFYTTVEAIAKFGDNRFDNNLKAINSSSITIASIDGDMPTEIAMVDFPNAKIISAPQLVGENQVLLDVASGKADITFYNATAAKSFMLNNLNRIKLIPSVKPIRTFANTFAMSKAEPMLLNMLNIAIQQLQLNGTVERLRIKYANMGADSFALQAIPYQR